MIGSSLLVAQIAVVAEHTTRSDTLPVVYNIAVQH